MTIGERIQYLRKKEYMSQEELAEQVEVSKQSVSKWELDKALPNVEKIIRLCDIFEVSTEYLIRGIEEPEISDDEAAADMESEEQENANDCADGTILDAVAEMSADSNDSSDSIENLQLHADIVKNPCNRRLAAGTCISVIVSIILLAVTFILVVRNNIGIENNSEKDYAFVDRIYEQHTKADVVFFNDEGDYYTKTVYLDLQGVNEGDWIICYPDDSSDTFRLKYRTSTCVRIIILSMVSLIISGVLIFKLVKNLNGQEKIIKRNNDEAKQSFE